jgi:hypothetical protein
MRFSALVLAQPRTTGRFEIETAKQIDGYTAAALLRLAAPGRERRTPSTGGRVVAIVLRAKLALLGVPRTSVLRDDKRSCEATRDATRRDLLRTRPL